jgi:hypothetical protein
VKLKFLSQENLCFTEKLKMMFNFDVDLAVQAKYCSKLQLNAYIEGRNIKIKEFEFANECALRQKGK